MAAAFWQLQRACPGFNPHGLLLFPSSPSDFYRSRKNAPSLTPHNSDERLRAIPASECNRLQIHSAQLSSARFRWLGRRTVLRKQYEGSIRASSSGYFETNLSTPLLEGPLSPRTTTCPAGPMLSVDKIPADSRVSSPVACRKRILIRIQNAGTGLGRHRWSLAHQRGVSAQRSRARAILFHGCLHRIRGNSITGRSIRHDPAKYCGQRSQPTIKEFDPHLLVTDLQSMDAVVEKAQSGTRFRCC